MKLKLWSLLSLILAFSLIIFTDESQLSSQTILLAQSNDYVSNCGIENKDAIDFTRSTCTIGGKSYSWGNYGVCEHPKNYQCCKPDFACLPRDAFPPEVEIPPVVNPDCVKGKSGCELCDDPFAYCDASGLTPSCKQIAGQCNVPPKEPIESKTEVKCGSVFNSSINYCELSCGNEEIISGDLRIKCCGWYDDLQPDKCSDKSPSQREIYCSQTTFNPQVKCRCDTLGSLKPYKYDISNAKLEYCCGYVNNGQCVREQPTPKPEFCGKIEYQAGNRNLFCKIGQESISINESKSTACITTNENSLCCLTRAQCKEQTGAEPPDELSINCGVITSVSGSSGATQTTCTIGGGRNVPVSSSGVQACQTTSLGSPCCFTPAQCQKINELYPPPSINPQPSPDPPGGGGGGGGGDTGGDTGGDDTQAGKGFDIFAGPNSETFRKLNPFIIMNSPYASVFNSPAGIINRVLLFLFPISGLILFFMLVWGGFEIVRNASGQKAIEAGRQRITMALLGFGLLFASFWIIQIVEYIFGLAIL